MIEDDPEPFMYMRDRFTYMNKAFIKQEEEIQVAMADYRDRSRNLTPFDAIPLPKISHSLDGIVPLDMDDNLRIKLTPLCELALNKYSADNQGAKFELANIDKTTWRPGGMYYITFQAKQGEGEHPSNISTKTFQAHVRRLRRDGPHQVFSCAIKT
ncbi:hypothetical protein QL285_014204 [Trifolium repens]|nr:hypothetical protein QL285_014204 [Trifolium repens]